MSPNPMYSFGKILLSFGILFILGGGVLMLLSRFNLPLGRLPGDIRIERENFTCLFPLASSILISVLLTLLLNLALRFWRR